MSNVNKTKLQQSIELEVKLRSAIQELESQLVNDVEASYTQVMNRTRLLYSLRRDLNELKASNEKHA